ncbi:hypothetical protein [Sinorhizobium meliloti]|uniref:hypothetical protein n=1 Tax=Rhizobium meliloti TaxID=382 RepID=UPI0018DF428E|nr:hypothetical protein [Sinorhizobium meliloti]MDE3857436.1 hypothetical protein [Sinorhizobium meliloti]
MPERGSSYDAVVRPEIAIEIVNQARSSPVASTSLRTRILGGARIAQTRLATSD